MEKKSITLNELFEEQSKTKQLVTIERIENSEDKVKITPWSEEEGCNCELSIIIPISSIKNMYKTEFKHTCCGKNLIVVELELKENAKISVSDIFNQQVEKFLKGKKKSHHIDFNHSHGYRIREYIAEESQQFYENENYDLDNHAEEYYYDDSQEFNQDCPGSSRRVTCGGRSFCVYGTGRCCGTKWCASGTSCQSCGGRRFCVSGTGTCCGTKWCPSGTHCRNGKCYYNLY